MRDKIEIEIKRYNWNAKYYIREKSETTVSVKFPKCVLRFYNNFSYKSIECDIINPSDLNQVYDLEEVLKIHNYDTSSLLCNHSEENILKYIEQFILVINENLLDVIQGDFSWSKRADDIRINTNYIYDILIKTSILDDISIFETSIYKKMVTNDQTWKEELKKVIEQNLNGTWHHLNMRSDSETE